MGSVLSAVSSALVQPILRPAPPPSSLHLPPLPSSAIDPVALPPPDAMLDGPPTPPSPPLPFAATAATTGPLSPVPTRAARHHSALLSSPPPPLLERPNPFDALPSPPPDLPPSPLRPSPPLLSPFDYAALPAASPSAPIPSEVSPPPLPPLQIAIPPADAAVREHVVIPEPMPVDVPLPPPTTAEQQQPDLDLSFDDDGLSALEKIYLFSRSQASFHRAYIARALPSILPQVSPAEAVVYVLPLLSELAMDEEEAVKEALAAELVQIVWWFATNCRLVENDDDDDDDSYGNDNNGGDDGGGGGGDAFTSASTRADSVPLPVHVFTPIIGTLLLSSAAIGAAARFAVVDILRRMHDPAAAAHAPPLFGARERRLLEGEIVQQVVVGIGRLDMPDDGDGDGEGDRGDGRVWTAEDAAQGRVPPGSRRAAGSDGSAPGVGVGPLAQVPSKDTSSSLARLPSPPPDVPMERAESQWAEVHRELALPADDADADAEQAAAGRLSSMSLIAAVSAGGLLAEDMTDTFVREVERVGRDPLYWVRKEASYALGALAKVVPKEIAIMALLPLFERLAVDAVWHVRHSALFALPAILSRLASKDRRALSLRVVASLSQDGSPAVRTRLLETLGEVIYAFRDDPGGPPSEILQLFVGPDVGNSSSSSGSRDKTPPTTDGSFVREHIRRGSREWQPDPPLPTPSPTPPNDNGPRPLICAFNLPAVALTLGAARWPELRPLYARLAGVRDPKVRRTLAASAGALARVVGAEHARRDVLPVWAAALGADEPVVRAKAVDAVPELVDVLGPGGVLNVVGRCWRERVLGWREREALVGALLLRSGVVECTEHGDADALVTLALSALEDETAAVRQAAVGTLAVLLDGLARWPDARGRLEAGVCALASASAFRSRVTFVSCCKELVLEHAAAAAAEDGERWVRGDRLWALLDALARDPVVDVRIGVARFVGQVYDRFYAPAALSPPPQSSRAMRPPAPVPRAVEDVLARLRDDVDGGVRAYVSPRALPPSATRRKQEGGGYPFATFSLPPPPPSLHDRSDFSSASNVGGARPSTDIASSEVAAHGRAAA